MVNLQQAKYIADVVVYITNYNIYKYKHKYDK